MIIPEMPLFPKGEPAFVDLLKQHEPFIPRWADKSTVEKMGVDLRDGGLTLESVYPDPEGLLDTAYDDFTRFLHEARLCGTQYQLRIYLEEGFSHEEYQLSITGDSLLLTGSDTEGIRRGIYYLRDLIAGNPCLKEGTIRRKPWLKNRISRCFFGPIKRPPFNIDELANEIDYYPEAYLSRLAQEGVNGLWLTIVFREICASSLYPEAPDAGKRLEKLRRTVKKCRRYGIKIWTFCIEPIFWSNVTGNPLPEGFEHLAGPGIPLQVMGYENASFCPNSPEAQQYLYDCTNYLFRNVPDLGGLMLISHGERMTSCLNCMTDISGSGAIPCDKHCGKNHSEILKMTLEPMFRGMKDASPDAEMISWLYEPYPCQAGTWLTQLPESFHDSPIALALNFESGYNKMQMGKIRVGGDYWLSAALPSERFVAFSRGTNGHCSLAAKIQVGTSHECATVPYIPVPGLLYRKYREMRKLGVEHVIQCWYFGNYPGLMNEAAGKLAFEDFSKTEEEFLMELALPSWGKDAASVAKAWKIFTDAYSCYPLDNMFQYYGPMHDGLVWPLYIKQTRTPLSRSWKFEDIPAGDSIGECITHFSLHEVAALAEKMYRRWHEGTGIFMSLAQTGNELEFSLVNALDLMFRSCRNILKFYLIRAILLDDPPDAGLLLNELRVIVEEELTGSQQMAELCRMDSRLGYHSEAEVYKYFPEKLEWRVNCLKLLLEEDFAEAEKTLAAGEKLSTILRMAEPPAVAGRTYGENGIRWSFDFNANEIVFHVHLSGKYQAGETVVLMFSNWKLDKSPLHSFYVEKIPFGKEISGNRNTVTRYNGCYDEVDDFCSSIQSETESGWRIDFTISRMELNYESFFYFGVQREIEFPEGINRSCSKTSNATSESRLGLWRFNPLKLSPVLLK